MSNLDYQYGVTTLLLYLLLFEGKIKIMIAFLSNNYFQYQDWDLHHRLPWHYHGLHPPGPHVRVLGVPQLLRDAVRHQR